MHTASPPTVFIFVFTLDRGLRERCTNVCMEHAYVLQSNHQSSNNNKKWPIFARIIRFLFLPDFCCFCFFQLKFLLTLLDSEIRSIKLIFSTCSCIVGTSDGTNEQKMDVYFSSVLVHNNKLR